MKTEFIYNINDVFGRVLSDAGLSKYYIGPYQRGYKWDSDSIYDQVPQLLIDIYQAWQKSNYNSIDSEKEYYLQYITVMKNAEERAFEVIDGQQRLTTLAIIFDRIHAKNPTVPSVAQGKLDYARDDSVTLFDKITMTDKEFSQDVNYIIKAREAIDRFLEALGEDNLTGYAKFMLESVKIILNRENDFVSPEEVFVNLNDNSVQLTNAYLIKGLFLTRSVRRDDERGNSYSYHSILEQRKLNGRMWDEIQNWIEQYDVAYYFFGKEGNYAGMEKLLDLILSAEDEDKDNETDSVMAKFKVGFLKDNNVNLTEGYRLYNRYLKIVKTDSDGVRWMEKLIHAYKKMRSFYEDARIYNLLGYVLFLSSGKERAALLNQLIDSSESAAKSNLAKRALSLLPDISESDIKYRNESGKKDSRLTPLLLSFSVFPEGYDEHDKTPPRFDFPVYDENEWSYEHIRPQNPPEKDTLKIKEFCRPAVLDMYRKYVETKTLEFLQNLTRIVIPSGKQIDDLKVKLNVGATEKAIQNGEIPNFDSLSFLYPDIDDIDAMGNMVLLSKEVNSSVSNHPFVVKRAEILKKLEDGFFIPSHTLLVFNKALNVQADKAAFSPDQNIWDNHDVATHAKWMRVRNKEIIKLLNGYKTEKK